MFNFDASASVISFRDLRVVKPLFSKEFVIFSSAEGRSLCRSPTRKTAWCTWLLPDSDPTQLLRGDAQLLRGDAKLLRGDVGLATFAAWQLPASDPSKLLRGDLGLTKLRGELGLPTLHGEFGAPKLRGEPLGELDGCVLIRSLLLSGLGKPILIELRVTAVVVAELRPRELRGELHALHVSRSILGNPD